jgi:hypothetical protein
MSSLRDLVYSRRHSGQGVVSSLAGGAKERLKEKFDPRQLINQKGLLAALFPGLKTYKAKSTSTRRVSGESIEKTSMGASNVKPVFESIQENTYVAAKNLTVLPAIHRDFNVIRQNLIKFLKLEKTDAATKADMYFKAAAKREQMYESQLAQLKGTSENSPSKLKNDKSSLFNLLDFLVIGGIFAGVIVAIKFAVDKVTETLDKLRNIDLKSYLENFTNDLYDSIKKLFDNFGDLKDNIVEVGKEIGIDTSKDFKVDYPAGKLSTSEINEVIEGAFIHESGSNYDISFGESTNKQTGKREFTYGKFLRDKKTKEIIGPNPNFKPQPTAEDYSGGRPLTQMTVQEVMNFQSAREKINPGQSAVGGWQFMPSTLKATAERLKKTIPDIYQRKFSPEVQRLFAENLAQTEMKRLGDLKVPVTQETLAATWGVGSGGTSSLYKALQAGKGNQPIGPFIGNPNAENNLWFSQSINQYFENQRIKTEKGRKSLQRKTDKAATTNDKTSFMTNLPNLNASKIDLASFDLSIREVENEIPFIIVNNNISQRTIVINKNQGRSIDPLKKLKTAVV